MNRRLATVLGAVALLASSFAATTVPGADPAAAQVRGQSTDTLEGYWMLGADGEVYGFGDAETFTGSSVSRPVALVPTPTGRGYWTIGADGAVNRAGDVVNVGSGRGLVPAGQAVTSASATPSGHGLWLFTDAGFVINLGDAGFFGDLRDFTLDGPVVASSATPTGRGYLMAAADGGVFTFGDAQFRGSVPGVLPPGVRVAQPVVGISPTPTNGGYWLVAADGGIFAFGDAPFRGSLPGVLPPGTPLAQPVNGMVPYGNGYLMVAGDGGIFAFSDLEFLGSLGANPPDAPIVSVAPVPTRTRALTVSSSGGVFDLGVDGLEGAELWIDTAVLSSTERLAAWSTPGPTTLGQMMTQEPLLTTSFVEAVERRGGDAIYAPVLYGDARLPGTRLHLGPSVNVNLKRPVSVRVPLSSIGARPGDDVIVLLSDGDSTEAAPSRIVGDEVWVDVAHFSWLDFILPSKLDAILDNFWDNPLASPGDFQSALDLVDSGPLDTGLPGFARAVCQRDDLTFDTSAMTGLFDLLNGLFVGTAGARGGSTRTEALADRIRSRGVAGENSVLLSEVFEDALDLGGGDVFQALALSHDVLSVNQRKPTIQGPVQNVLPPGRGLDQVGGRYHVLGSATYSFMFEYAKTNGIADFFAPDPSTSVFLEEAWVSGDIRTETHELVLDNKGVALGRQLFDLWRAKTGRGTSAQRDTFEAFCGEPAPTRLALRLIEPVGDPDVGETVTLRIEVDGGYEPDGGIESADYLVNVRDVSSRVDLGAVLVPYRAGRVSAAELSVTFTEPGSHLVRADVVDSVGSAATDSVLISVDAVAPVPADCDRIGHLGIDLACSTSAKTSGDLTLVYVEFETRTTTCFSETEGSTSPWTAEHRGEIRYTSNVEGLRAQVTELGQWMHTFNLTCLGRGFMNVTWNVTPIVGGLSVRYADALLADIGAQLGGRGECRPLGWPDCELARHGQTGTMDESDAT